MIPYKLNPFGYENNKIILDLNDFNVTNSSIGHTQIKTYSYVLDIKKLPLTVIIENAYLSSIYNNIIFYPPLSMEDYNSSLNIVMHTFTIDEIPSLPYTLTITITGNIGGARLI